MAEEKDVYNFPLAAFTFGKEGEQLSYYPNPDLNGKNKESIKNNNNSIESKDSKDSLKLSSDDDFGKRFSFKNIIKKNYNKSNNNKNINKDLNNDINNNFIFIDKEDSNSSYLKSILYALSYMDLINNYIINELNLSKESEDNNSKDIKDILLIIRDILIKINQIKFSKKNNNNNFYINNIINIEQLKENLSELFSKENKFLKNSPDDPMDFLYIIINSFHDLTSNKSIKKFCNDCFSHENISMILYKAYECECKAQTKPILNINNYFIDIPINNIINKYSKEQLITINQMLFNYYQKLISNIKIKGDCPLYEKNCAQNKVHKKYILRKCPSYLIFNLENDIFKKNELYCSLDNILKNFILIPHILNINTLFDLKHQDDNSYYELIGIIFLKISKVYTCMFKSKNIFYYYEDNTHISFDNYYDIIMFSLKNGNIPIALFYQNIDLNKDKNNIDKDSISYNTKYELTLEQINKLEKYVKNTNNLNQNLKNKIRTRENIISDNFIINYSLNNTNNPSYSDNNTSSRYSNSINSYNSYPKAEYICKHCERINKIENQICFFCGFDNSSILNNMNDNNIRKLKNNIIIKRKIILKKEKLSKIQENNELGEIEDEYKNIAPHVLKYFDMSKQNIHSKKDIKNIPAQKQKLSYNNIINSKYKTEKKFLNIKLNNSSKLPNKSSINRTGFKSFKAINKTLKNNFMNYSNRNSNKDYGLNDIDNNSEFYSEQNAQYNSQLNINLKINNNNNYNIFEFGAKKDLIKLNNYNNKFATEENYTNNNINNNIPIKKNNKTKHLIKIKNNKFNSGKIPNNISTRNWICINCFNQNDNNMIKCSYCQKERFNKNINKSPKNKSRIINENRIKINNLLIGQLSTKNKNIINKI